MMLYSLRFIIIIIFIFFFVNERKVESASYTLEKTINNPAPGAGDYFGVSVAALGSNIIVGASSDDTGATDAGSVYFYSGATWDSILTINNPAPDLPTGGDAFGYSVAALGSNIIVGAYLDDTGAADTGSAYLMNGSTGATILTINNPYPAASDNFGVSVAALGSNIIVGAYADDTAGTNSGSVYIMDGSTEGVPPILTINDPGSTYDGDTPAGDLFGRSVAALGSNIIVGAYANDYVDASSGSVYLMNGSTGARMLTIHNPEPGNSDYFGLSTAALGSNIIVGPYLDDYTVNAVLYTDAGSVYLMNGSTGETMLTIRNPFPANSDYFGRAVAALGSNIIVGAYGDDTAGTNDGSIYLFHGRTGELIMSISNPDYSTSTAGQFGVSVAALGSNRIIVGAFQNEVLDGAAWVTNAGSAYVYRIYDTLTNIPFDFGESYTAEGGGGSFEASSVTTEGDTTAVLGAPNSVLADNDWHIVPFGASDTPLYYNFSSTAVFGGGNTFTFSFNIDPANIPFGLGTDDLRGIHVADNGDYHIINGAYNAGIFTFTSTYGFSSYGVGVNPEPATLLLLLISLGGLWRFSRRR